MHVRREVDFAQRAVVTLPHRSIYCTEAGPCSFVHAVSVLWGAKQLWNLQHMHFTLRAKHFAVVPVTKVLDSCTQVEENIQLLRQEARARRDVLVGLASDSVNNVWTRRYSLGVRAVI